MQSPKTFSLEIENIAIDMKISHMDAVLYYCDKNQVEVESVSKLITKALKDKIEANARELKLLNDDGELIIISLVIGERFFMLGIFVDCSKLFLPPTFISTSFPVFFVSL